MPLESLWQELRAAPAHPAYRRVDEHHALDLYAGVGLDGSVLLMLVCDQDLGMLPSYDSLKVEIGRREDGRVAYSLSLQNPNLEPLFAQLCVDLIESSRAVARKQAASFFAKRLDRWRRLLATGRGGLTEEEARGLLGELYVLSRYVSRTYGIRDAVRGWVGPQGQEQDFRIGTCAFEVKAIEPGKQRVQISSLGQLDGTGCELTLIVVNVSPAAESDGALSIAGVVGEIQLALNIDQSLTELFAAGLFSAGYSDDDPAGARYYHVSNPRSYRVSEDFPRLLTSTVPLGVIEAKYTIDLGRCAAFEEREDFDGH